MNADREVLLENLIAEARLRDLVAQYANVIDWLDWDRLADLFWPDAKFDFGMFKGGLDEYRRFVVELEESYRRRLHMFTMPVIRVTGQRARVDVGCIIVCRTDDPMPGIDDVFYGRYLLEAERRNREWRLGRLTYILNLFDRRPRSEDDRVGPMNFGDDLSPVHPFAVPAESRGP
jgi:hypothetical protein